MSFREKAARFLSGRHGTDALNVFLLVLCVLLLSVALFLKGAAAYVLRGIALVLLILNFARSFSRNNARRKAENDAFTKILYSVKSFFIRQFNRIKYVKTYRYRKCPGCRIHLRLPYKKGSHTVKCPKCGTSFGVRF